MIFIFLHKQELLLSWKDPGNRYISDNIGDIVCLSPESHNLSRIQLGSSDIHGDFWNSLSNAFQHWHESNRDFQLIDPVDLGVDFEKQRKSSLLLSTMTVVAELASMI